MNNVVNWRNYSKRYLSENETYYYPDDTYKLDLQGKYAPFGYLSQNINLSYTYNDVKDFLSIQFRNTLYSSHDRNYIDVFQDKPVEQQSFRDIASTFDNYTPALDIYYIRRIDDQQGIEANVVGTLMNTDYKRNFIEKYSNDELIINNITDGKKKSIIFEEIGRAHV